MAKYTFTKPFSVRISMGNNAQGAYSKNVGETIDGDLISAKGTGEQQVRVLINPTPQQGADSFVYIPLAYFNNVSLQNTNANTMNAKDNNNVAPPPPNTPIFTFKNVVISLVVIGSIFGILKVAKVI